MLITPTYTRKKSKFGKFYLSAMVSFGRVREFRRVHKTATEAQDYAKRAARRFIGLFGNA